MVCKKDEEVRVINRLYDQATKHGRGEEWYAKFLHFVKTQGLSPIRAATKATREDITLNTLYETRPLRSPK